MYRQQHYQGPNVVPIRQRRYQTMNDVIPGLVPGILGAIQLFLWIAIIILEVISVYYDAGRGTIYAGFWCSIAFCITWISMLCYLCCGKSRGCGSFLVVQNLINLVFTIILLAFSARFLENPCKCYGIFCRVPNWESIYDFDNNMNLIYICTDRTRQKVPVLRGLVVCAILMLASNIVFICIYLIVSIRLRARTRFNIQTPDIMYQQQSAGIHWIDQPSYSAPSTGHYPYRQPYRIENTQATAAPWPSAPPSSRFNSSKF